MAARRSNSVVRATQVLELLAERPTEPMALAEIARRVGANYPSTHAVVSALEDVGYVRRHRTTRSVTLGPGLVALAQAATRGYTVLEIAIPELHAVADDLGVECHAGARSGADIVILARTGRPQPVGRRVQVGDRIPLVPPVGLAFVAWAGDEVVAAYLDRSPRPLDQHERLRYHEALQRVRERGFSVVLETSGRRRIGEIAEYLRDDPEGLHRSELEAAAAALDLDEYGGLDGADRSALHVSTLNVPVFGPGGDQPVVLGILGLPDPVGAGELDRFAERLLRAARTVEARLGPTQPGHSSSSESA